MDAVGIIFHFCLPKSDDSDERKPCRWHRVIDDAYQNMLNWKKKMRLTLNRRRIPFKGVLNPGSGGFSSFSLIPPILLSKNAIALVEASSDLVEKQKRKDLLSPQLSRKWRPEDEESEPIHPKCLKFKTPCTISNTKKIVKNTLELDSPHTILLKTYFSPSPLQKK